MSLRAIIIDDEYKGLSNLKTLIEEYVPDVRIVAECTKASMAIKLIEDYKPEIVFLDINMPEMTGFDLLDKLSWKNFNLVFTTAHQEYALKALKNNAVDYILKPIDHEEIKAALVKIKARIAENSQSSFLSNYSRLLDELSQQNKNKILVSLKSGIEAIDVRGIIYLESKSNYTKLIMDGRRSVIAAKTLKEFDELLAANAQNFMRVHNSFLINLKKVIKYLKKEDLIVLENYEKVPLAKSKKNAFVTWLNVHDLIDFK